MILAGTGHRPDRTGGYGVRAVRDLRAFAVDRLRVLQPSLVISGMALGWDQALCHAAIELGIPFHAYVPFNGQESAWPWYSRDLYNKYLKAAEGIVITSPGGFSGKAMQARNEAMVDACDRVLALWDGYKAGGTWNCMVYARDQGKPITYCWQHWMEWESGERLI